MEFRETAQTLNGGRRGSGFLDRDANACSKLLVMTQEKTCGKIHVSPTANGDIDVPCGKEPGHVERGDLDHLGRVGVFPVKWRDEGQQPN